MRYKKLFVCVISSISRPEFERLVIFKLILMQFNDRSVFVMLRCRLTPVYAFVIFYYATLLEHAGSGPLWTTVVVPEVKDCQDNWYLNMLYLNNYIRDDHLVGYILIAF